jgi:hypothetical protein
MMHDLKKIMKNNSEHTLGRSPKGGISAEALCLVNIRQFLKYHK